MAIMQSCRKKIDTPSFFRIKTCRYPYSNRAMEKENDILGRKAAAAAVLGAVMIIGVCIGYFGIMYRFYEMTFLSNAITGTVLLVGASRLAFFGKDIPHALYLDCTVLLTVVVFICATFAPGACFGGPGVILHLVNPALVIAFYLLFCDARGVKKRIAFTALVFPSLYYIFMIVFGRVTGGYIYEYFDPNRFGTVNLVLFAIIALVLVSAVAFALMAINIRIKNSKRKKATRNEGRDDIKKAAGG